MKYYKYQNAKKNKTLNINNKNNEDEVQEEDDTKTNTVYREGNHIYFYTEIDSKSISELTVVIREAEEYSIISSLKMRIDEIPIYLHIFSNGGCLPSVFLAIDIIQSCKVPVYSIIEGATASAGTLMSVVCKKRYIRPMAYMLIHQLSSEYWGKMSEITDEYKNLTKFMNRITDIYREYTTLTPKKIDKMLKHDLWLDARKSKKYGLVDELFT